MSEIERKIMEKETWETIVQDEYPESDDRYTIAVRAHKALEALGLKRKD
jgi:hypothetical protein